MKMSHFVCFSLWRLILSDLSCIHHPLNAVSHILPCWMYFHHHATSLLPKLLCRIGAQLWAARIMTAVRSVFAHCIDLESRPHVWNAYFGTTQQQHMGGTTFGNPLAANARLAKGDSSNALFGKPNYEPPPALAPSSSTASLASTSSLSPASSSARLVPAPSSSSSSSATTVSSSASSDATFELSFLFQQLILCQYATRLLLHRRAFQLYFTLISAPQLTIVIATLLLFLGSGGAYPSTFAVLCQPLHFALVLGMLFDALNHITSPALVIITFHFTTIAKYIFSVFHKQMWNIVFSTL